MIDLLVGCVRLALCGVFRHGALRPPWSVPGPGRALGEGREPLALREPGVTEQTLEAEKLINPWSRR